MECDIVLLYSSSIDRGNMDEGIRELVLSGRCRRITFNRLDGREDRVRYKKDEVLYDHYSTLVSVEELL